MSAREAIVKWWLGSNGIEGSLPRWTSAAIENTDDIFAVLDAAGYAVIPKEPTREMLNAAIDTDRFKLGDIKPLGFRCSPQQMFRAAYAAMLNAAKEAVIGDTPCHSAEHAKPETTPKGEQDV